MILTTLTNLIRLEDDMKLFTDERLSPGDIARDLAEAGYVIVQGDEGLLLKRADMHKADIRRVIPIRQDAMPPGGPEAA